jgi:hypothetical protein
MPLDKIKPEAKKAPGTPGLSSLTPITPMDRKFCPQTLGGDTVFIANPFIWNILAITLLFGIFYRHTRSVNH